MSQVFLNYRTDDERFGAAMLDQNLSRHFGSETVFLASKSIRLGSLWEKEMFRAVEDSVALLAVMGRNWLTAKNSRGVRRIDDPADFVRREILLALELGKPVIPVRLDVPPLRENDLSDELKPLARRQGIPVRFRSAKRDIEVLARRLREDIPQLRTLPEPPAAPGEKPAAAEAVRFSSTGSGIGTQVQANGMTISGDWVIGTVHHHAGS